MRPPSCVPRRPGPGWPGNREAIPALRERAEAAGETTAVRAAAVHSLGIIGDPSMRAFLVAATRDPDAAVRQGALWSVTLGPLADPTDRTSYLIRLAEDRDADGLLRCDAIRALVDVKEDRVGEAFMRIVEREPPIPIKIPETTLTQPQIMELRRVQARDVAAWAAGALGEIRPKGALTLLLKTAEDPTDFFLRQMSLTALITLGGRGAPGVREAARRRVAREPRFGAHGLTQLADKWPRLMLPRLNDNDPLVRSQAVVAVATLGDATVRPCSRRSSESSLTPTCWAPGASAFPPSARRSPREMTAPKHLEA